MSTAAQYASVANGNNTPAIALTANGGTLAAPTNTVTVYTAGANGSRVDDISIVALGANIANTIQFYLYDGTTYHALQQIVLTTATTPSTGVTAPYFTQLANQAICFKTGWSLRAGVQSTEANGYKIAVTRGGDF